MDTPPTSSSQHHRLARRAERERRARKEAEKLLDEKSRALFVANRDLESAHAEQKQAADQMRAVLERMPNGVVIASAEGAVEYINFVAQQMFGSTPTLARKQRLERFLPQLGTTTPDGTNGIIDAADPVRTTAQRSDGTYFSVEVSAAVTGSQGQSIIWMVRDITGRVMQEERRKQLESQLSQAQRLESLGTMAGGIAHELNTPIQFVTDNTKFLADAFKDLRAAAATLSEHVGKDEAAAVAAQFDLNYLDHEVPQAITQSLEGLTRIAEIVLAVKRFSHPAGTNKEDNDLNEIVRTAAMVTKNQWKYVADLDLDLEPNLPLVRSNAGELNQVFLNLIVNAAHAIEDNGGASQKGKITLTTRAIPEGVEVRITDTGAGIKPEIKDRVFDLFFTTKAPGRGTGQGLSLVHAFVAKNHGGMVEVESEPGQGATFIVTLPAAVATNISPDTLSQ